MPSAAFFVGLQHRLTDPHIRGEFQGVISSQALA